MLAAAGAAVGMLLAAGLTSLLKKLLFGIQPLDPVTFIAVPLLLCAVAMAASYIPARKATRVPALEALRAE
jgi:putative ABC transport system permease protein